MTGDELLASFRVETQDIADGQLWADEDFFRWLTEAEAEAAIRKRLIFEADNAAVCQIAVTAGRVGYPLHPKLFELDHVAFRLTGDTERRPLELKSTGELDRILPRWRDDTGTPCFAIQTDTTLRLVPKPDADGKVLLEGYRMPLKAIDDGSRKPEILEAHHRQLLHWVLHRAYGIQDADTFDPQRSERALAAFEAYFGPCPDADLRRATRTDVEHHNHAHLV